MRRTSSASCHCRFRGLRGQGSRLVAPEYGATCEPLDLRRRRDAVANDHQSVTDPDTRLQRATRRVAAAAATAAGGGVEAAEHDPARGTATAAPVPAAATARASESTGLPVAPVTTAV